MTGVDPSAEPFVIQMPIHTAGVTVIMAEGSPLCHSLKNTASLYDGAENWSRQKGNDSLSCPRRLDSETLVVKERRKSDLIAFPAAWSKSINRLLQSAESCPSAKSTKPPIQSETSKLRRDSLDYFLVEEEREGKRLVTSRKHSSANGRTTLRTVN